MQWAPSPRNKVSGDHVDGPIRTGVMLLVILNLMTDGIAQLVVYHGRSVANLWKYRKCRFRRILCRMLHKF